MNSHPPLNQPIPPQSGPSPQPDVPYQQVLPDPVTLPRRSRSLGVIAFVLVVAALILFTWISVWLLLNTPAMSPEDVLPIASGVAIAGIGTGLIGFVLSVVAVATRRGRMWGVIGMIVGLLDLLLAGSVGFLGYLGSM